MAARRNAEYMVLIYGYYITSNSGGSTVEERSVGIHVVTCTCYFKFQVTYICEYSLPHLSVTVKRNFVMEPARQKRFTIIGKRARSPIRIGPERGGLKPLVRVDGDDYAKLFT